MDTITIIILTAIAISGFPTGLLIAKLTKEELKQGKIYFNALIFICIMALITTIIFAEGEIMILLCTSFLFIIFLTLPSLIRFKKKKKIKYKKR